jgi:hypothetical protein
MLEFPGETRPYVYPHADGYPKIAGIMPVRRVRDRRLDDAQVGVA